MNTRSVVTVLSLLALIALSSLRVASDAHELRLMNERLHQLQELRPALEIQRGQLLIERSSLVTPARIEERAVAELGMRVPEVEEIQVIRP